MSKRNDGGPAFPRPISHDALPHTYNTFGDFPDRAGEQDGMTLRDYYAGQALASELPLKILLALQEKDPGMMSDLSPFDVIPVIVYKLADAMLVERDQE